MAVRNQNRLPPPVRTQQKQQQQRAWISIWPMLKTCRSFFPGSWPAPVVVSEIYLFFKIFSRCLFGARFVSILFCFFVFPLKKKKKEKEKNGSRSSLCTSYCCCCIRLAGGGFPTLCLILPSSVRAVRACGWCGFNFAWMDGASFPAAATRQML